jgi:hypothetical protein
LAFALFFEEAFPPRDDVERAAFFAVDGPLEALLLVVAGALFLAAVFIFFAIL